MKRNYPEIIISNEGVTWLDKGQMWMYRNNLEKCDPPALRLCSPGSITSTAWCQVVVSGESGKSLCFHT